MHAQLLTLVVIFFFIVLLLFTVLRDLKSTGPVSRTGFKHSPGIRSSSDIIFACLTTMAICAFTAMHFDVRDYDSTRNEHWYSKLFWLAQLKRAQYWNLGLLMPEYIVFKACSQYYDALEDYNAMIEKHDSWTLKHSFFVKMGGFAIKGVEGSKDILNVAYGLDLQHFTTITEKEGELERLKHEISDKSKSDVLAKSLAVLQISRFLLEIISRAASSLPISPLEYFTCAQVFCALLSYTFWFDKPHNVQVQIRVERKPGGSAYLNTEQKKIGVFNLHSGKGYACDVS